MRCLGALPAGSALVVGGDFNAFPWSARTRTVARTHDLRLTGPVRPSFRLGALRMPLDFVMATGGGRAELRGFLGSDHRGVLAQLRP